MKESTLAVTRSSNNPGVGFESYPSWRALAWFSLLRLCIAFGLLAITCFTVAILAHVLYRPHRRLCIAKELSEANGVELEYIAREERGTCFGLTFSSCLRL